MAREVAALALLASGAALAIVGGWIKRPAGLGTRRLVAVFAVLLLVTGALTFLNAAQSGGADATEPPDPSTTHAGARPTGATASRSATPGASPSGDPTYLSDLRPVEHDASYYRHQATINGGFYPHSVGITAGCGGDTGDDKWLDYSLSGNYRRLRGVVGLSDENVTGVSSLSFAIFVDGFSAMSRTLKAGDIIRIDVDVTAAGRLRLMVRPRAYRTSCAYASPTARVEFADAALYD